MKPSEVLIAAATQLEPKGAWTQHAGARDANGRLCMPTSSDAKSWDAVGAIESIAPDLDSRQHAVRALRRSLDVFELTAWNNALERTQAQVVAALRDAACELEKRERAAPTGGVA